MKKQGVCFSVAKAIFDFSGKLVPFDIACLPSTIFPMENVFSFCHFNYLRQFFSPANGCTYIVTDICNRFLTAYSASCRRHAYDEHLKYFHSLFNEIRPVYFVLTQMWTCCCIRFLIRCFLLQSEYCLVRSRTAKIQRNGLLSRCTVSSVPIQEKIGWRQLTAKMN